MSKDSVQLNLQELRRSYLKGGLNEDEMDSNPFKQFASWFEQAQQADLIEPNAMIVATVDTDGQPSTRTVLLKYFDEQGFVFFTNYTSQKAQDIAQNPKVALQFLWLDLERQIKILGTAEKISTTESMRYFLSRPKGSQIGAWVSRQSEIVSSKDLLKMQYEKLKQKFSQGEVPFPDFWGGYRIRPTKIEFWQGGENRLHDRIVYTQQTQDDWVISRLAP
ncbi:pyridoxamine 5'-phosphate oxidase [Thiosulfativibrio zosterae]|uniref:Pyridoxine/pyridoxamine 5'-phosphate oxidase n=1 Tax=Thiosulfativibrio zosterae TaxID=2675053 RepID=A0A6F8PM51_9GAMM|nr:pyridoxamine 5'-phosphate oxidase [Thiosulfativibrio zosterae]BBP43166.1 pyridoxine/pyridoxamine 5'-phosphate oxidase [Thiosulfativibrio zosterae]